MKVSVRFRGREMAHTDIGRDLLKKFAELCADVATMDKSAKMEGRLMSMFLSPKAQRPENTHEFSVPWERENRWKEYYYA